METAWIQCDCCGAIFPIEDPDFANGIPQPKSKISTEAGCPECLHPDGTFIVAEYPSPAR